MVKYILNLLVSNKRNFVENTISVFELFVVASFILSYFSRITHIKAAIAVLKSLRLKKSYPLK
jgi:hypothetical protein